MPDLPRFEENNKKKIATESLSVVSKTIKEIEKQIDDGQIYNANIKLQSLIDWCFEKNRMPQLNEKLKNSKIEEALIFEVNEFLACGLISNASTKYLTVAKLLTRARPEEVADCIINKSLTWDHHLESSLKLTGYSSDIFSLKMVLYFLNFSDQNYLGLVEVFKKKYIKIAAQAYKCMNESERKTISEKLRRRLEKVKVTKNSIDLSKFDFSKVDTAFRNNSHPKPTANDFVEYKKLDELNYLHHFIDISESICGCLDSLFLNQLFYAADFYLEHNKGSLKKNEYFFYKVIILEWFQKFEELEALINKNTLFNTQDVMLAEFYLKVLKRVYEKR